MAVLDSRGGHAVVVDAGPDPALAKRCLDRLRVRVVDLLVLTHTHADHMVGIPGVLSGRSVGAVWTGPLQEPKPVWDQAMGWLSAVRVPVSTPVPGDRVALPGVALDVIAPARVFRGSHSDTNNSSLVIRASLPGFSALLSGDAEAEAQALLLGSGSALKADVLKVPHHGSRFQLAALLDAVGAAVAVTSVGAGNSYGHPAPQTLDRLRAGGALVLRTDQDGSVALVAGAGGVQAVPDRQALPAALRAVAAGSLCGPRPLSPIPGLARD